MRLLHLLLWLFGLARPGSATSVSERDRLAFHAEGRKRVAEIGVWEGVSTSVLRRAMAADGILFAIDPYPPGRLRVNLQQPIARREVARIANGNVEWLRMTGEEAARFVKDNGRGPIDFVFIDGDHSYEGLKVDWDGWSPLMAPGGIVALHDSRTAPDAPIDDAGSVRFFNEIIAADPRFEIIDTIRTLTVLRRKC
jgi:predicted O-methyltransferase YrrM